MKFKVLVSGMDWRRYFIFLVPAVIGYFAVVRLLQDSLTYPDSGLDPYPGIPLLPEPYEIPLYFLGYVAIPLTALVLYKLWRLKSVRYLTIALTAFGTVAVAVFLLKLDFPGPDFIISYLERRGLGHAFWLLFTKRIFVLRIAFLAALISFVLSYLIKGPSMAWIKKVDKSRWLGTLLPIFLILLIVLIFHPNFPSEENYTNFGLSPAHDLRNGKPLLYESSTQYGLLNVYAVAAVVGPLLPVSYKSFSLLLMIFYLVFFLLLYFLLKKWLDSRFFALLGTWLGVIVGFFLLTDPFTTAFDFLGQTVYRQGFYILPAFLLVLFNLRKKVWLRESTLIAAAVGLFWSFDTGIYLNIAVFSSLAYYYYQKHREDFGDVAGAVGRLFIRQVFYILLVFGMISGINFLIYSAWPDWEIVLNTLSMFASGFGKLPMPALGLYQIYVLVYLGFLIWIGRSLVKRARVDLPVVFFTVYGIFSLLYYVGNSAWSNLNMTALPMLVLLVYGFKAYFVEERGRDILNMRIVRAAFSGLLIFATLITIAKIPVVFAYRDYSQIGLSSVEEADRPLQEDARYIHRNFEQQRIPLFHESMGKLLVMGGKVNYFQVSYRGEVMSSFYDNWQIVFRHQVQDLKDQLSDSWPRYVFITTRKDERVEDFESFVSKHYELEKTLNTVNIYRLANEN